MSRIATSIQGTSETKEERKRSKDLITALKGKRVTILGHDNIDVDATLSGILMSKLLDFLKIENQFCILEPVEENDTYKIIMELFDINMKEWEKEKYEIQNLLLVDHYTTEHKGNVIACIDHHPSQQKISYDFVYVKNSSATAYLIYEMMKEVNFPIQKDIGKMILVAMMVDTTSFRSTKTIAEEVKQAKLLAKQYQLDYKFLEKYCLCLTEIDNLSIQKIITNGQKWYNYSGRKIGSSYLQLYGLPDKERKEKWLEALRNKQQKGNSDMLVFIIFETKNNMTYQYQIMSDHTRLIISKGILSRGKDIMPLIESEYLNQIKIEN